MPRISPQEYELYRQWLEARETHAPLSHNNVDEPSARLDTQRLNNCETSNDKPRGRSTQRRQLALFQDEDEESRLHSEDDSESLAPARQYRTEARARGKDTARARRCIESRSLPELDDTPHTASTSHVPHRRLPLPRHEHPRAPRNQSNPPSPSLASPCSAPAPRSSSLAAPSVSCCHRSPSPHPSRDPSPGEGPWPYSRDASLERPVDNVLDEVIEPVPEANLNEPAVDDPNPYDYPYDETPTSRVLREVDGKRARGGRASSTRIEKLGDRLSKHLYTRERVHPFAIKHGISWFNPYSAIKAPLECYKLIKKPEELVTGPGQGGTQLHEKAGLRSDLDFWSVMRRVVREGLARFAPRNLEPGVRPTWSRYSTSAQRECYRAIPAFQHFRNKTGEDCWLIAAIAQQYLQGKSPSLTITKKFPPKIARDINPDLDNYNDDYSANARVPVRGSSPSSDPACIPAPRATSRAPAARAVPARAASHATGRVDQSPNHPNPTTNPRAPRPAVANTPGDQPDPLPASHSSSRTYDLPPNTTKRQNRKADKKTAAEEALADASRARTSAQAPVAPCPNQKQHALSEPTVASDEESDEEPVARNSVRKIKPMAREHAKAKPPVQETEGEPAPAATKKTGKATKPNKAPTKAPAKTPAKTPPKVSAKPQARSTNALGKRKADQAKDDQDLTANKRSKATGNVDTPKRKAVEDDEGMEQPPKKKQAYPRMRPAPSEPEPEPESPNPPASPILSTKTPLNDNDKASQDNVPAAGPSHAAIDETLAGEQPDAESSNSRMDKTNGLRVVGTSKIKIVRPAKQVAPSDRQLRTRG
ncbi:hypothetical protein RhiJN_05550 [Ceratobasidium sp. AG-Ba]|nr:hypothetical protein RhiJN_05550 [Ceratobasidium sp. AG-Ba]